MVSVLVPSPPTWPFLRLFCEPRSLWFCVGHLSSTQTRVGQSCRDSRVREVRTRRGSRETKSVTVKGEGYRGHFRSPREDPRRQCGKCKRSSRVRTRNATTVWLLGWWGEVKWRGEVGSTVGKRYLTKLSEFYLEEWDGGWKGKENSNKSCPMALARTTSHIV